MDVNKIKKISAIFLLVVISAPCLSEAPSPIEGDAEILKVLKDSLAGSVVNLEKTIERCSKIANDQSPAIIQGKFDGAKSKEDLIVGISHFYFKNMFECEKEARSALAYDLAMLISFNENFKIPTEDIELVQSKLVLQPFEQIGYQVKYNRLDSDLKDKLSEKLSGEPFDLLKVLEANGLSGK
jgi:hypothetical protein